MSPTSVLKEQKGNCFDYAILLTSLLVGVGYDAYCVCGYASEDICLLNLGRNPCPKLKEEEEVWNEREREREGGGGREGGRDVCSSCYLLYGTGEYTLASHSFCSGGR